MKRIRRSVGLCVLMAGICPGCASVVPPAGPAAPAPAAAAAAAPAAKASCTLPQFLGLCDLNQCATAHIQGLRNCLGMQFPGLEAKPPLRSIADPANAAATSPEVSSAAKIKQDEDMADQKIKALRDLAGVGCANCYPDVEKSFLDALSDCTEVVRFEAIQALRKEAGCPCQNCRQDCCCTPAIQKRLEEIGCGIDDKTGCYKERSARVRRVARLALQHCPPLQPPEKEEKIPIKGGERGENKGEPPPLPPGAKRQP